jgi:thioredoxin-dependent peroxiredoxin
MVSLSKFKGKPVLIYFYPKDETPGCTKEACTLRDQYEQFEKLGAIILGVSVQDEKSHQAFIKHDRLPFDLLVDADGKVAKLYGVGNIMGTSLLERKSVLVGPDQKVLRVYDSVDPSAHASQVIKDITDSKTPSPSKG